MVATASPPHPPRLPPPLQKKLTMLQNQQKKKLTLYQVLRIYYDSNQNKQCFSSLHQGATSQQAQQTQPGRGHFSRHTTNMASLALHYTIVDEYDYLLLL